ncbi:hypothetical protein D9619_003948 [Psilocybe cf. subviscida]|uniref:Nephrocystin 3-like N-terminal domain-containing protein n=1 Tax=Psilocybe cf. subviscida TaxID=2480587 RepID=A0A8H5BNM9_9AGAR|nr:hypothetical protein D9619_003948 [Psilocybe cf. subviscida]
MVNNNTASSLTSPTNGGFNRLHARTAVTALHNALDSFESGRCHPNTREMVLNELFQFIQDDPKTRKNWILWLSGPAGSGKTTIARTLAYLCDDKGVNQASFFFCRMDLTRNGIKPLVATLAYQIACRFSSVRDMIVAEIERRPHIFDLSVEEQFRNLITTPLINGGWKQDLAATRPYPIVCVIDALDECDGDRSLDIQFNVVQTLYKLVSGKDSPVIFMLASRPEANLRMSFNRIQHSISRVYLDSSYDPSGDIRRFVVDKFDEIRTTHPFGFSLPQDWPQRSTINAIVTKSSGQFIYAAMVMRYVSSPYCDPAISLDNVCHSQSENMSAVRAMPFTELDNLFSFILGKAMFLPLVLDTLACHILSRELSSDWFALLLELHGHKAKWIHINLIDIVSLVDTDDQNQQLILHNESLIDFLLDYRRSGRFYIDVGRAAHDMVLKALHIRCCDNVPLIVDYLIALLPKITYWTVELELELLQFSREAVAIHSEPFLTTFGFRQLLKGFSNPYVTGNKTKYIEVLNIWMRWPLTGNDWSQVISELAQLRGHFPDIRRPSPPRRSSFCIDAEPPGAGDQLFRGHCGARMPTPPVAEPPFTGISYTPPRAAYAPPVPQYSRRQKKQYPQHMQLQVAGPGSPAWFNNKLRNGGDLRQIKHLLASVLISEATGMLYGAVVNILGYDSLDCARILSSLPSLLEYNSERQIVTFHHGRKLLDYMSSARFGIYHIDIQASAIQMIIQMLSSSNSYKGNIMLSKCI